MSQEEKKNTGIDLEDFLEFYLLDSYEQVDKLGSGLLQLEKDGENISLINELFRSVHSLKGASGTMGFTPIVELTHNAEDLLDKIRQGRIPVTNEIIDVLLEVADRVKKMLVQVENRQPITEEYAELLSKMKVLSELGVLIESRQALSSQDRGEKFEKRQIDFSLTPDEMEILDDTFLSGKAVYQLDIKLAPQTMMKDVRALMVSQRLEQFGRVVKIVPSLEELSTADTEKFSILYISNESPADIKAEILGISEIRDVAVHPFSRSDAVNCPKLGKNGKVQPSAFIQPAEQGPKPVPQVKQAQTSRTDSRGEGVKTTDNGNNHVHTIRVDTARMDNLINLVGEMVITRTRLVKIGNDLQAQYQGDSLINSLNETNVYLGRLMSDLQESVMRLRMVPIGTVFSRFPRLVRDLCRKTGKKIELAISGEETELDKTVIEAIGDPLTHLIRNSVDHGIEFPAERLAQGKPETGTITLNAYQEGNHIAISIADDGVGLKLDKIYQKALEKGLISEKEALSDKEIANLIFLPGFSTAENVTEVSGRGVGMDVVKKALDSLGGLIEIKTNQGQGTQFIIRLPLTLAIIQALLVKVEQEIYAIPLSAVNETLIVKTQELKTVGSLPMVRLRGNTLPLLSLRQKFDLPENREEQEEFFVVVVGLGDKAIGLIVDELLGQQEIVIKTLGEYLSGLPGIAGATILGDGKVTLILDTTSLLKDVLIAG
ncbi:MAG TPA: chemotaxis protein CheA [Peptococcaceae bacterium]|nr:chemotaxis protein CheA [Peptococcaceae bacterium]